MTHTLTTERMDEIAKLAVRLQQISSCAAVTSSGETVMHHTFVDTILSALHDVTAELLANREAQPVACDIERIKRHALPAGECPKQSQVVLLSSLLRLFTAPPVPAVPDRIPEIDRGEGDSDIDYMAPQEIYDMGKTDGWNAYRAAMLGNVIHTSDDRTMKLPAEPEGGNDHDTRR